MRSSRAWPPGQLRHADHRFEWTRAEFAAGPSRSPPRFGYRLRLDGIGAADEHLGHPSQMAVFERHGLGAAPSMKITIPEFCLVALVGTSGSGKSTFARRHFLPTEVISLGLGARRRRGRRELARMRPTMHSTLVHYIAEKRLRRRKLVVIDATNVRPGGPRPSRAGSPASIMRWRVAIVVNPGEEVCHERNRERPDRQFGPHVVRNQTRGLKRGHQSHRQGRLPLRLTSCARRGHRVGRDRAERLWTDRRDEHGPFDIIGDVHGCADELIESASRSSAMRCDSKARGGAPRHLDGAAGRRALFVGDLVDRGPRSPDVLRIVMHMVRRGPGARACPAITTSSSCASSMGATSSSRTAST